MLRINIVFVIAAIVMGTSPAVLASPTAEQAQLGPTSSTFDAIDRQVAAWVKEGDPVGAELLVIQQGEVVLHRAYGWNDRDENKPMQPESIFRVRSMTKPIVGTAIMILSDEGRLNLDDPASRYIPSFRRELLEDITIRQLLSHTSGLRDHGAREIKLPIRPWEFDSLADLIDAIANAPRDGLLERYHYSDSNSAILGHIVTIVTGLPVEQFIQERIFDPLGMTSSYTYFAPGLPWAARLNSAHNMRSESCDFVRYWHPGMAQTYPFFRASGGIYSTTQDYARFMSMWLNNGEFEGKRLLSAASVQDARRPYANRGSDGDYGLHWMLFGKSEHDDPFNVFGHGGSDGTLALAFPENETLVLFFTQSRRSPVRQKFIEALRQTEGFGRLPQRWRPEIRERLLAAESMPRPENITAFDEFVGTYDNMNSEGPRTLVIRREEGEYFASIGPDLTARFIPAPDGSLIGKFQTCEEYAIRAVLESNESDAPSNVTLRTEDGLGASFLKRMEVVD